jgi:predicted DNA-binding transcriptional regulator YafY
MRADRLISSLLLLQAHGRLTGRALANRLEVSERTVHRDMEALSAAGVPVFALRGSQGGWQLDENWRTQVPGLDEAELRALLMAQPRVIGDPRLAAAAESALGKLLAVLPGAMRERASSIRQRLYVDTNGWRANNENLSMLSIVQDAVARDQKIWMRYNKAGREVTERIVDPLGLVAKNRTWYLVAQTAAGIRTYRISRILDVKLLNAPSERPANFDLAAYWRNSVAQFTEAWQSYEVTLRVERDLATWLKMWQSALLESENADRWVTLRIRFDHEKEARFIVMGLGSRAEVIEPASLRDYVKTEVKRMMDRLDLQVMAQRK